MEQPQDILCAAALRTIEQAQGAAVPPLMERAGAAAAGLALELTAGDSRPPLVVAGPGNNGGDAFVVARLLKAHGLQPTVLFVGDADHLPIDARSAYEAWRACGGTVHRLDDDSDGDILAQRSAVKSSPYSLVIDGLFGIGLTRDIEGHDAELVAGINQLPCPILALDIASGIDSETGVIRGVAVRASHCATFIALKPGLLTLDGPDHCGRISVHDLGIAKTTTDDPSQARGRTITPATFAQALRPRRRNSHKGSYGNAGILGGAPGMAGAVLLAGRAAAGLGAGRTYLGMLERLPVDMLQPELMLRAPDDIFELADCLAVGPGLGQSEAALVLLRRAIPAQMPLLLDADALNLLATHPVLMHQLRRRDTATILTPHPAEAARLLGVELSIVQADRRAAALELAQRCHADVVLKGCGSVVALHDGRWFINTSGNPGLASAGSGDVLSGMTIALLAQKWPSESALLAAVHLHGAAADLCVAQGAGPIGLTAGELIAAARTLLNRWIAAGTYA